MGNDGFVFSGEGVPVKSITPLVLVLVFVEVKEYISAKARSDCEEEGAALAAFFFFGGVLPPRDRPRWLETISSDSSSFVLIGRCCRFDRLLGVAAGSDSSSLRLDLLARSVALALRDVVI